MKKCGNLHLTLKLNIWIAMTICISFRTHCNLEYFYGHEYYSTSCTSCIRMQLTIYETIYIRNSFICTTHSQLCKNNYCVTLIQLICNYHGNVMLTSFFINPSKFDTWHYEEFLGDFFGNIDLHHHYDCSFIMLLDFDTCHNKSFHVAY